MSNLGSSRLARLSVPALLVLVASCASELPLQLRHGGEADALEQPGWATDSPAPTSTSPPPKRGARHLTRTIPGGLACLIRLNELGISHRHLGRLRGVLTPIEITGPIGGVRYRSMGRRKLVCDCRLALALHRAAPVLLERDLEEVQFSNAYSYRMMPSGKPSRHAMGLAIDVHRVVVRDQLLRVKADYEQGRDDSCDASAPPLNQIACQFKQQRLFDRVLTPDFDRAHYNHLHLAILSLHRRRFVHRATAPAPVAD